MLINKIKKNYPINYKQKKHSFISKKESIEYFVNCMVNKCKKMILCFLENPGVYPAIKINSKKIKFQMLIKILNKNKIY